MITRFSGISILRHLLIQVFVLGLCVPLFAEGWTAVTEPALWAPRIYHQAAEHDGKLWLLGGARRTSGRLDQFFNDVWSSEDGIHWTMEVEEAPWEGRAFHGTVQFNGKLLLAGGYSIT